MKVFTGDNLDEIYTRNEIQDMLYDAFGIEKDLVIPTSRDKMDISFSLQQVNEMEEDEFYWYFTLDPVLTDTDKPKSSFKDTSKKMKVVEDTQFIVRDGSVNHNTYESYLKSTTPKSSFKDLEKKIEGIRNAND